MTVKIDGTTGITAPAITNQGLLDETAGQIKFPAVQNPSADANTLDDYEEGTWTPVITPASGAITSYTVNSATYTKVGRQVAFSTSIAITNNGTGSGSINIAGLPFACGANQVVSVSGKETNNTGKCVIGLIASTTSSISQLTFYDNTYPGGTTANILLVSGTYFV